MTGLTQSEVIRSREEYGTNQLPKKEPKRVWRMVLENLSDPIIRILIGALIVNILFTYRNINWPESLGILAAVIIATVVSVISERSGERAFEKMNEIASNKTVRVIRASKVEQIAVSELVVGDCIQLGSGESVPADAVILEGELILDQSALNGEAAEVKKQAGKAGDGSLTDSTAVHSGSMVLRGSAVLRVTGVGGGTTYGKIASELQNESRESPMKFRLSRLATVISRIGYVAAALVALTYLLNVFVLDCHNTAEMLAKWTDISFVGSSFAKALTIGITVIVVAVPEGLPMMLTVVLSANMRRMYKDSVLVRKPIGIETAGSMNLLFCDKTGTLTTGQLSLNALYLGNLQKIGSPGELRRHKEFAPHFMLQAYYNTESIWEGRTPLAGNATERAILQFAGKAHPNGITVTRKIPFDSKNKYSACTLDGMCMPITCYKGAPELLLPRCHRYLDENGIVQVLGDKTPLLRKISEISARLGRVIALCEVEDGTLENELPKEMTLVALVAMQDEIRPGVVQALRKMTEAGVQTVMVTGDSRETALAIAARCGVVQGDGAQAVITSSELSQLGDAELKARLPLLRVVARALPQDKSRLVRVAEEAGLVVGMTGDGVNDAPALKMADIGFAMGNGTDVAKEAGDIVILDSDFSSIVKAVLYGRTIFKSVRKFIVFQLTMNLCAVGVSLFGQMVGIETPVTVIQMLWVNIIMDTLGGLAFAGEAPLEAYMKQSPVKRSEPILRRDMVIKTLVMGAYTILLSTLFLYSPRIRQIYRFDSQPTRLLCAFFALFIFCGIWICFTARSERGGLFFGIGKNKTFLWIMGIIFAVQMTMLYFGGATFRCVALTPKELAIAMLFSLSILPVDFMRRIFCVLHRH